MPARKRPTVQDAATPIEYDGATGWDCWARCDSRTCAEAAVESVQLRPDISQVQPSGMFGSAKVVRISFPRSAVSRSSPAG